LLGVVDAFVRLVRDLAPVSKQAASPAQLDDVTDALLDDDGMDATGL
jgi:hypothetical protein